MVGVNNLDCCQREWGWFIGYLGTILREVQTLQSAFRYFYVILPKYKIQNSGLQLLPQHCNLGSVRGFKGPKGQTLKGFNWST